MTTDVLFIGLPGPTYTFGGLSSGNKASLQNGGQTSNPRLAALQSLDLMRRLVALGVPVVLLPPHERPCVAALRAFGFTGSDANVVRAAAQKEPDLLIRCSSASSVWAANAATVTPSIDTEDGLVHITPANLAHGFHRSLEADFNHRLFRRLFASSDRVVIHPPLPPHADLGDEGAANHLRLSSGSEQSGTHLFCYGRTASMPPRPTAPARQTLQASRAVARRHQIVPGRAAWAWQHPAALDAGAFHTDVVALAHEEALLYHEHAFVDELGVLAHCRQGLGEAFAPFRVSDSELSLAEAVRTYVFNAQLVTTEAGTRALFVPSEAAESRAAWHIVEWLQSDLPGLKHVEVVPIRESMRNGGGPACLRLRVPLTAPEARGLHAGCRMSDSRLNVLGRWVERHYRDRLDRRDLGDPALLVGSRAALDELTQLLDLEALYPFQTESPPC